MSLTSLLLLNCFFCERHGEKFNLYCYVINLVDVFEWFVQIWWRCSFCWNLERPKLSFYSLSKVYLGRHLKTLHHVIWKWQVKLLTLSNIFPSASRNFLGQFAIVLCLRRISFYFSASLGREIVVILVILWNLVQ